MPLARALTKRLNHGDSNAGAGPFRSFSMRKSSVKPIDISLPINLISTTNMQSYDAPDIVDAPLANKERPLPMQIDTSKRPRVAPIVSVSPSDRENPTPSTGTEPELTDGSSCESSPRHSPSSSPPNTSPLVQENHLSCYFPGPTLKRSQSVKDLSEAQAPAIPQRALSHSKREHERLARKRSFQSVRNSTESSSPSSRDFTPNKETPRTSAEIFGLNSTLLEKPSPKPVHHPFSQELEKLDEVVEGYHAYRNSIDSARDEEIMTARGLIRFTVDEYLLEIGCLYSTEVADEEIPTTGDSQ